MDAINKSWDKVVYLFAPIYKMPAIEIYKIAYLATTYNFVSYLFVYEKSN